MKKISIKRGYTLIELLVVIGILAIIASMALPNSRILERVREKNEIGEFKKDLLMARNRAILESKIYLVDLNFDQNSYEIKDNNINSLIKRKYFDHGIKLSKKSNTSYLTFGPSGSPLQSGTIRLTNKRGEIMEITITPVTGRIEEK